jgi:Domain of unknown function (DUF4124)
LKRLIWAITLILPVGVFAGEIYRSVDDHGIVVYSDRPSKDAEEITVNIPGVTSSAAARQPAKAADAAKDEAPDPTLVAQIPRESTPEEIAADRTKNCDYARQMQTTFSQSHRLYRNGPNGEHEYLSDAEISEQRAKADSEVAKWCK